MRTKNLSAQSKRKQSRPCERKSTIFKNPIIELFLLLFRSMLGGRRAYKLHTADQKWLINRFKFVRKDPQSLSWELLQRVFVCFLLVFSCFCSNNIRLVIWSKNKYLYLVGEKTGSHKLNRVVPDIFLAPTQIPSHPSRAFDHNSCPQILQFPHTV